MRRERSATARRWTRTAIPASNSMMQTAR
jgi:hypothetical protein